MEHETLSQLWQCADKEAVRIGSSARLVFEPIGLTLIRPPAREGYESTPLNSEAFAKTGGEGVHFSILRVTGDTRPFSPIVMTVPMDFGNENLIVGSDLRDFLCLGCKVGYFLLELLTYGDSKPEAIHWLKHPDEWFASRGQDLHDQDHVDRQRQILRLLQKQLRLKPWEDIEHRIESLQEQFLPLLETPG